MRLTRHGQTRMQQRALAQDIIDAVYAYGTARHVGGAVSYTLDRSAIALACEGDCRIGARLMPYRGCYLIIGECEAVITVAHRTRRFRADHRRIASR